MAISTGTPISMSTVKTELGVSGSYGLNTLFALANPLGWHGEYYNPSSPNTLLEFRGYDDSVTTTTTTTLAPTTTTTTTKGEDLKLFSIYQTDYEIRNVCSDPGWHGTQLYGTENSASTHYIADANMYTNLAGTILAPAGHYRNTALGSGAYYIWDGGGWEGTGTC